MRGPSRAQGRRVRAYGGQSIGEALELAVCDVGGAHRSIMTASPLHAAEVQLTAVRCTDVLRRILLVDSSLRAAPRSRDLRL